MRELFETEARMSRRLTLFALVVVLLVGAVPVRADSVPVVSGLVSGLELCAQDTCGAAVFVGFFLGQVGSNSHAIGTVGVAVKHDELPVNDSSLITGGVWRLRLLSGRTLTGEITGGLLVNPCNNSQNAYCVAVDLEIKQGGHGTFAFEGVLSHEVFPPTISGTFFQVP
jgi:hypothetical protein